LTETEISNTTALSESTESFDRRSTIRLDCLTPEQYKKINDHGFELKSGMSWMPAYENISSIVPIECLYASDGLMAELTLDLFAMSFNSSVSIRYDWPNVFVDEPTELLSRFFDFRAAEYQNITAVYMTTAGAIDRFIRQAGPPNSSTPAPGIVYGTTSCLLVQWMWLIPPSVFTVAVLLFFVALLLETMPREQASTDTQQHDFKGSPLALLFHGLDEKTLASLGDKSVLHDTRELKKAAKATRVRLMRSEHGWKFSDEGEKSYESE
jgi:hypothetical protein